MNYKFYYIKSDRGADVKYFECSFCKYFQIDDEGNYLCWRCEDGAIKVIPKWRTKDNIKWNKKEILKKSYKSEVLNI